MRGFCLVGDVRVDDAVVVVVVEVDDDDDAVLLSVTGQTYREPLGVARQAQPGQTAPALICDESNAVVIFFFFFFGSSPVSLSIMTDLGTADTISTDHGR